MTTEHEQLIAFLATLVTIVVVFALAILTAANSPQILGKIEVFALGTVLGGLIGILKFPSARSPSVSISDTTP